MNEVTRHFYWHQNFVPWGLSAPALGLSTCINHEKKSIKSDFKEIFLKLATNDRSDTMFLLTSKFHPQGVVSPCPGAMYMYNSWKKSTKSDFKESFLKLAANDRMDTMFLLTSKFHPKGVVSPCPGAIYMYKIMKKLYKIRLQRDFFETCNKWPKWHDVPDDIKFSPPRGCQPLPWGYIHV